jgi:hypothetical protein
MKHLFALLLFICGMCNAQTSNQTGYDLIIKNDKTEIKAKVIEIQDLNVVYKKYENLQGPNYNIAKNQVFMIIYANGSKETFDVPAPAQQANPNARPQGTVTSTTAVVTNTNAYKPVQQTTVNPMAAVYDLEYHPIRFVYNLIDGYDWSLTMLGDIPLTPSTSEANARFNLGLVCSGGGYNEDFSGGYMDVGIIDVGLTLNMYLPINKLTGATNVNTGLFPFVYAGGVYRSTSFTYDTFDDYYSESEGTVDFAGGVGVDWRFTRGFGLTLMYDYTWDLGLGINFQF